MDKTKKTLNVVVGRPFEIACPAHGFTQNAFYKWGGISKITGTWFVQDKANMLVLEDGRLFFSHVTREDVKYIKQKGGMRCFLEASHGKKTTKLEQSGVFELNVTGGTNTYGNNQLKRRCNCNGNDVITPVDYFLYNIYNMCGRSVSVYTDTSALHEYLSTLIQNGHEYSKIIDRALGLYCKISD